MARIVRTFSVVIVAESPPSEDQLHELIMEHLQGEEDPIVSVTLDSESPADDT